MESEQNRKYLLNTLIRGLDKSNSYIKNRPYFLMDVLKRQGKKVIFLLIIPRIVEIMVYEVLG